MSRCEVVDLTTICGSFPKFESSKSVVYRDNYLDLFESFFKSGYETVIVEGEEGIGKTTLLAHFAKRHPDNTISLFIRNNCMWGYDPDTLRFDLCNQLEWMLNKSQINDMNIVDMGYLRSCIWKLNQFCKFKNQTVYFVIDGLDDIPQEYSQYCDTIMEMLPFGYPSFHFLISYNVNKTEANIFQRNQIKSFTIPPFSFDETLRYFSDIDNIQEKSIIEIYRTFKKPGHLSSIKRILLSGTNVDCLISEMPQKLSDLFEIEWEKVNIDNDIIKLLLGILSHDDNRHTIDFLSEILKSEKEYIENYVNDISFLYINTNEIRTVCFVSDAYRRFVAEKLNYMKNEIHNLIIDYFLKQPESDEALSQLPTYFEKVGRNSELISYLSTDRFAEMFSRSQSIGTIINKTKLGINAAQESNRDGDLFRFSLHKNTFKELDGIELWRSEIEARIALGDYNSAIGLVQSVVIKEDRLHLLAIIAKKRREDGVSPEVAIIEQIRNLHTQIDYSNLGDKAIEIASDLIHTNPDIAIEIVEKSAQAQESENSLDLAFAKLSLSKLVKVNTEEDFETLEKLNSRIKSVGVKQISKGVHLLVGEYSFADLINEVDKLEGTSEKLFFIRQWLKANKESENAYTAINYAIKLAVKTTEYNQTAALFRELAVPLPYIKDYNEIKKLVGWFDAQKNTAEKLGPPEDFVRLQLILAKAEIQYDFDSARNRIVDTYLYICDLSDLVIKTECLSRLLVSIDNLDPTETLEKKEGLFTLITTDFHSNIRKLIETTGDHYNVFKGIISTLAKKKELVAYDIAISLNTLDCRNEALYKLIENYLSNPDNEIEISFVIKVIIKIDDNEINDSVLFNIFERIKDVKTNPDEFIKKTLPLINMIKDVRDANLRCRCLCCAYVLLDKSTEEIYENLKISIINQLEESWNSIDIGWQRIDTGFKVCAIMAEHSDSIARESLKKTDDYKKDIIIDSENIAITYISSIRLMIRSFGGLIPRKAFTDQDVKNIGNLIAYIPSYVVRCHMWSELALRFHIYGLKDECAKIVDDHIKPLLLSISSNDVFLRDRIFCEVAPALYCAHQIATISEIEKLPLQLRDSAYLNICKYILCKVAPSEPYDIMRNPSYKVEIHDIIDLCLLLDKISIDYNIYHIISSICDTLDLRRSQFNKEQQLDIVNRLENIINSKLPNNKYITHNGYVIISKAQIARILSRFQKKYDWNSLLCEVKTIPNVADKAFILGIIASYLPLSQLRKDVVKEAEKLVDSIPSTLERVEHYRILAQLLWDCDKTFSKSCLQKAMKLTVVSDKGDALKAQKNIIDIAHRLEPEFASALVSLITDDEARIEAKQNAKRQLEVQKLKEYMIDRKNRNIDTEQVQNIDYSRNAWKLLGMLNSGKIDAIHMNQVKEYVNLASKMSFGQSYPILSWTIENVIKRLANTDQVATIVRPIFDATYANTHLFVRMVEKSINRASNRKFNIVEISSSENKLINPGEREQALEFIREWLSSNLKDSIIICDPYFDPDSMEILRMIRNVSQECSVQILTSWKKQREVLPSDQQIDEYYSNYWRSHISEQNMPCTEMFLVFVQGSNDFPIHDRWWISGDSGLNFGTSFNSLGSNKLSGINILTKDDALRINNELIQYITRKKKEHNGSKLIYTVYTLY